MKRSKKAISPSISPLRGKQKRRKESSPTFNDTLNTPDTNYNSNTNRTSGGISKSLLTPCRRMGLNRNRNKAVNIPVQEHESPLSSKKLNSAIPRTIDKSSDSIEINRMVVPVEKTSALKIKSCQDMNLNNAIISVQPQELKIECNDIQDDGSIIEPADLKHTCMEIVNKKMGSKKKSKVLPAESKKIDKEISKTAISSVKSTPSDCTVSLIKITESNKTAIQPKSANDSRQSSQKSSSSSHVSEDDDEDNFENKTILERKCYKNLSKTSSKLKMNKSTKVNITDSDITDIKRRIKDKQDRLEAISKTEDSHGHSIEELENLIVSWRGGCRKALEELLQISKERGNFNENMGMEELLKMLNIPFELVKYNLEQMTFD